jgi:hypothetical protein
VIEALAAAVTEGRLTERRIDESIRRLETLFDAYVKPPESA